MRLVTSAQMAAIDRRSIEEHGIDGYTLMKRAGKAVIDELIARSGSLAADRVVVLCGRGNNGGDGFVIARLLREQKADVECVLIASDPDALRGAAKQARDDWEASGGTTSALTTDDAVRAATRRWRDADYLVDALLGTGLSGEVRGVIRTAIDEIANIRVPVIAVDIPSGISGDTGEVLGAAIPATLTVTFGLPKVGHAFHPGKRYCGTLVVADIGFPREAVEEEAGTLFLTGRDDARSWIPQRAPNAHKGTAGTVLVIAGSTGMTGAAALTSEAAFRAGCGLVYLACPAGLNDILEPMLREVVTRPLPEIGKRRCLATRALGDLRRLTETADAVAIGPGIGRHHETIELVRRFVSECNKPMVIDADALFALAKARYAPGVSKLSLRSNIVLTPHAGELARLLGVDTAEIAARPLEFARRGRDELGATVLLKGNPTVICGASGAEWVNTSGNAGMATGGAGDVLTGIIAGLIAQGVEPETGARLGAYLHGMAGDRARDELGIHGMIAGDILRHVPGAMKEFADERC